MTRNTWEKTIGACGLMLGIGLIAGTNTSNAADDVPKNVKDGILKIAAAQEAGKKEDAKKEAETLAKTGKFDGGTPGSCETLMHVFSPRKKGGFGFGEKPGMANDGIEMKLDKLGEKQPSAALMKKEGPNIKKMAYVTLAVAEVTLAAAPKKDDGKKKAKDWIKWTQEMREAAAQLAVAAEKGDAKMVSLTAKNLGGTCASCHEVFRK